MYAYIPYVTMNTFKVDPPTQAFSLVLLLSKYSYSIGFMKILLALTLLTFYKIGNIINHWTKLQIYIRERSAFFVILPRHYFTHTGEPASSIIKCRRGNETTAKESFFTYFCRYRLRRYKTFSGELESVYAAFLGAYRTSRDTGQETGNNKKHPLQHGRFQHSYCQLTAPAGTGRLSSSPS